MWYGRCACARGGYAGGASTASNIIKRSPCGVVGYNYGHIYEVRAWLLGVSRVRLSHWARKICSKAVGVPRCVDKRSTHAHNRTSVNQSWHRR